MATVVLVHPAWFGGWCWKKVVPPLRSAGHTVHTPTLTGLGERAHLCHPDVSLTTHVEDIVSLIQFEALDDVTLVANSSGGTVITAVASRIPELVARLVYLDAFVPSDGQGTADLVPPDRRAGMEQFVETEGEGWLMARFSPAPWETTLREVWGMSDEDVAWVVPRLRPTPWKHFTEPARVRETELRKIPRAYVRARVGPFPAPMFDECYRVAQETDGWTAYELDAPHIPYITHPDDVTDLLLEIV